MNSNDPRSSDLTYKKYSLQHLDEWISDAINCEDITPEEIYDTIVKAVDENIEYHKGKLTKNIELLSLLKGQRPVNLEVTEEDWADFWNEQTEISQHYSEEDLNAMCDAAEEKEKCREYNLREAEYYNKRAELDAKQKKMSYQDMIDAGWTMTADGFWIKETDKGVASVSK